MKKQLLLFFSLILTLGINAQTIYDIQGQAEQSPYADQSVSTKGIVTAIYSGAYCIQDGDSAWTGLYVYDFDHTPALGDSIEITGTIVEYYLLTELKTITAYTTLSTGNTVPNPILINTGDADESFESVLITVKNATCTNTDLGYGEWEVNDGSGELAIDDLGTVYTPILGGKYIVTGPLYYSFDAYKIIPPSEEYIVLDLPIYYTKNPSPTEINKTSLTLNWELNVEGTGSIEYGLTTNFELGTALSAVSSTTHSVTLSNLEPGNIYYTKTRCINNSSDTTLADYGIFSTQSESSGEINVYFNHEQRYWLTKSGYTTSIIDTIISYITKATTSIDITMYDLTNHAPQSDSANYRLIQAVNKAYNQGISIRFITDDLPSNTALDSLNTNIPLLKGNPDGIMHDKFLVIDANNAAKAWVVTGSMNWTYNNLMLDYNNMVCIQDQSLAKAYTLEFNEMWGSKNALPNSLAAKFGADKTDNTPHIFNINSTPVELYFSPSDNTTSKITDAINKAENDINFAMMVFTENTLGTAMANAHKRGISINGLIDYVDYSGSEYDYLVETGVNVIDFTNPDSTEWPEGKTLHHKFCIIDANGSKPLAITGTHNWSASAESINDENTLFIYNKEIADLFKTEYYQIQSYVENNWGGSIDNSERSKINIYPNPAINKTTTIRLERLSNSASIRIYNCNGALISQQNAIQLETKVNFPNNGLYLIEITNGTERITKKLIVN